VKFDEESFNIFEGPFVTNFSYETGRMLKNILLGSLDEYSSYSYRKDDAYVMLADSTFICLQSAREGYSYVQKNKELIELNESLAIESRFQMMQIWNGVLASNSFQIIGQNDNYVIIDENGKQLVNFKSSKPPVIIDSFMFLPRGKKILKVDLMQFE